MLKLLCKVVLLACVLVSSQACTPDNKCVLDKCEETTMQKEIKVVTGTVQFPKNAPTLPPVGTTVSVVLADVSLADAPYVKVAEQVGLIVNTSDMPFSLAYTNDQIKQGHSYAVSARVEHEGRLLYINDAHIPVIVNRVTENVSLKVIAVK